VDTVKISPIVNNIQTISNEDNRILVNKFYDLLSFFHDGQTPMVPSSKFHLSIILFFSFPK